MPLEDLTGSNKYISDLVETNPDGAGDGKAEGDNHIRGVKNVLKNTLPNVAGEIAATHTEIDAASTFIDGLTAVVADVNLLTGLAGGGVVLLTGDSGATKGIFYQDSAPTGWTIDTTIDEHSVRLTKGSVAGGQAGGIAGGTNDFSSQFADHAEGAALGVGDHLLTWEESGLPAHTHTDAIGNVDSGSSGTARQGVNTTQSLTTDANIAEDASEAHSHTLDLQVKWAACIVATKD